MSGQIYSNQGTITATAIVSLDPDRSGNFVSNGVADQVEINAAIAYVAAVGGGEVVLGHGDWALAATVNVPVNMFLRGVGWETVLNYNAGGNCITVTGDNVKIRDLKIVIVAGAGGAGTRPNCILADTRTNIEITKVWLFGDRTVGLDASDLRQCGIVFSTVTESKITTCRVENQRANGMTLSVSSDNICTDNTSTVHSSNGIFVSGGAYNIFNGNQCISNGGSGIRVANTSNNIMTGNTFNDNVSGIRIDDASNCSVVGNLCNVNTSDGITITDVSLDNLVQDNTCNSNGAWGINIDDVRALRNWVKNNQLRANGSGAFNDDVANLTKLATVPIPLVQGTTFISAADEAWGWEIDADTEFALGICWLPIEVQQVVRIRVIGVALADPGVGNAMRLQITGEGATFHEPFATNPIDVVDKDSEELDTDIGDVIQWIFDSTDDADIGNLLGGDRLQLKVLHEGAGNGNIETDAVFSTIEVEVV